jgi:hypothetical protein
MKILHLLRSEPSKLVNGFIDAFSENNESEQFYLYKDKIDYSQLISKIFENDRIISWW